MVVTTFVQLSFQNKHDIINYRNEKILTRHVESNMAIKRQRAEWLAVCFEYLLMYARAFYKVIRLVNLNITCYHLIRSICAS